MKNKIVIGLVGFVLLLLILFLVASQRQSQQGSVQENQQIKVSSPTPNQTISSPLNISGTARGSWFFEASFPIKLLDSSGNLVVQSHATAEGDWMTDQFVPFSSTLIFKKPASPAGTLVLEKDNPSGLPENSDQITIPIQFEQQTRDIKLYYYNPSKDKDQSGNLLCSRQGLVSVDRQIRSSQTPIQDSIKLLLEGQLTDQEKNSGITTEYPLAGFELKSANPANKILTLEFADSENKTGGGSCRVGILWFQIEATAKQFPNIDQVEFQPESLFQP